MNVCRLAVRLLLLAGALTACDVADGQGQTGQTAARSRSAPAASASPRLGRDPLSGLPFVAARALPPEGQRTLQLIRAGGPFPFRKDGSAFGNREGLLPRRVGYREYTVPTPGEADRGARRIVCAARTPPEAECYYSADHYSSFQRIRP